MSIIMYIICTPTDKPLKLLLELAADRAADNRQFALCLKLKNVVVRRHLKTGGQKVGELASGNIADLYGFPHKARLYDFPFKPHVCAARVAPRYLKKIRFCAALSAKKSLSEPFFVLNVTKVTDFSAR
jgi:hypothetical protein